MEFLTISVVFLSPCEKVMKSQQSEKNPFKLGFLIEEVKEMPK